MDLGRAVATGPNSGPNCNHDRLYCEFASFRVSDNSVNYSIQDENSVWTYESDAISANYEYTVTFQSNIVIQLALSMISLVLNGLVVILSLRTSRRSSMDVALSQYTRISLAYADILSAFSTFASTSLLLLFGKSLMTEAIWNVIVLLTLLQMYFVSTSFCHLILMSLRRYQAITAPLSHLNSSRRRFFALLVCVWLPGLCPTTFTVYANTLPLPRESQDITSTDTDGAPNLKYPFQVRINEWLVLSVSYIAPYVVTVLASLAMVIQYYRSNLLRQKSFHVPSVVFDMNRRKKDAKFVTMILMIFIGYSITCLPFIVTLAGYVINNQRVDFTGIGFTWPATIMSGNGAVDVLVYSMLDRSFKTEVKYLVRCSSSRQHSSKTIRTGIVSK